MSIHFHCPNGHALKISEHFAGHTAHCPRCQAPVVIPQAAHRISDDAIVDLLGTPSTRRTSSLSSPDEADLPAAPTQRKRTVVEELAARGLKRCPKCHREVGIGYAICIYCRTYFTDQAEVARREHPTPRR